MSKRFGGENSTFAEKMDVILERMREVPEENRGARFRCCVAYADCVKQGTNPSLQIFEATCEGKIALEPSGNGGFGYDPIFWLSERGCTMADLTAEEKHKISHRGKVLLLFGDWLEQNLAAKVQVKS